MKTRTRTTPILALLYLLMGIAIFNIPAKAADYPEVSYRTVKIDSERLIPPPWRPDKTATIVRSQTLRPLFSGK